MNENWTHHYQEREGWCGPACIQMILEKAGVELGQKEVASQTVIPWWGCPQQVMVAFLSRYFERVNYKYNATTRDFRLHLALNHGVIINWWDDRQSDGDGHYSILTGYNKRTLVMLDPSTERTGVWVIPYSEFKHKFYDTHTVDNKIWSAGWMTWIDLSSLRNVAW